MSPTARPALTSARTNGPSARVAPSSGPPGTELTVSGSGWPAGVEVVLTAPASAQAYARVTAGADGSFTARFRLEKGPNGASLETGRLDLVARSAGVEVAFSFLVETPRPVGGGGSSG